MAGLRSSDVWRLIAFVDSITGRSWGDRN